MQEAGRRGGARKGGGREARLAAKLRQNLLRRKAKARASGDAAAPTIETEVTPCASDAAAPVDDSDRGA
jgi:hypothetical protein